MPKCGDVGSCFPSAWRLGEHSQLLDPCGLVAGAERAGMPAASFAKDCPCLLECALKWLNEADCVLREKHERLCTHACEVRSLKESMAESKTEHMLPTRPPRRQLRLGSYSDGPETCQMVAMVFEKDFTESCRFFFLGLFVFCLHEQRRLQSQNFCTS